MKTCKRCNSLKPFCDFYTHSAMSDGRLNICIECTKQRVNEHRSKNIERIREYDRERGRTEERKKKAREVSRRYFKKTNGKSQKAWIVRNPKKRKAHIVVGNAVRAGKLLKSPCQDCGNFTVEAHHPNYDKPLEVVWLCRSCHSLRHKKYLDINHETSGLSD